MRVRIFPKHNRTNMWVSLCCRVSFLSAKQALFYILLITESRKTPNSEQQTGPDCLLCIPGKTYIQYLVVVYRFSLFTILRCNNPLRMIPEELKMKYACFQNENCKIAEKVSSNTIVSLPSLTNYNSSFFPENLKRFEKIRCFGENCRVWNFSIGLRTKRTLFWRERMEAIGKEYIRHCSKYWTRCLNPPCWR